MSGVLSVCVLEGKDLPALDAGGTSDPYVILYYGQYKFQTQVVDKDLFPQWLEEVCWVALPTQDLSVYAFDRDKLSSDDSMGQFKIEAPQLHDGKLHDEWFSLPKKGQIRLRWRYLPHMTATAAAPSLIQSKKHAYVSKRAKKVTEKWENCWAELRDDFLLVSSNPGDKRRPKIISLKGAAISKTGSSGPQKNPVVNIQTAAGFGKLKTWNICFGNADVTEAWERILHAVSAGRTIEHGRDTIEAGVAFLTLVEADKLSNKDFQGISDPFAIIYVGNEQRKSATQRDTLSPKWNESFDFMLEGLDHNVVVIILDEDRGGHAEILGSINMPLKYFADGKPHDEWFDLADTKGRKAGRLHLQVNFVYEVVDSKSERKVFGVPLVDLAAREKSDVPKAVSSMLNFLTKHACETEGIFRISASANAVREAQVLLDIGKNDWKVGDEFTVAALFKSYLRALPDALLLDSLSPKWLVAKSPEEFKSLWQQLPTSHKAVLSELVSLMRKIVQNEAKNKMSLKNLCICIAPNLLRISDNQSPLEVIRLPEMLSHLVEVFDAIK